MAQVLETQAPRCDIGLCHIGTIDFDKIRHLFDLDRGHVLIHSMVGGRVADDGESVSAGVGDDGSRVGTMVQRLRQLSPDDVQALLEAERSADGGNVT